MRIFTHLLTKPPANVVAIETKERQRDYVFLITKTPSTRNSALR
ncbi:hypothetical protein HRbin10_02625 [bacterium HR10]|nr:hypothetical protein HRbin10_02625 [bacterium HR10]